MKPIGTANAVAETQRWLAGLLALPEKLLIYLPSACLQKINGTGCNHSGFIRECEDRERGGNAFA